MKPNEIVVLEKQELTNRSVIVSKQELRKYMEKEEIIEFLNNMSPGRDKMLITMMWMTGLRVSEVNQIRKCDINFKDRLMTVRWLKNRKYIERVIPIKKELSNILEFYTTPMKWDEIIFNIQRAWIYKIFQKHLNVSPHCMRHSFAVNFLKQSNCSIALVILKRLLGHSKIETTMVYLQLVPMDMAIELEKVEFN